MSRQRSPLETREEYARRMADAAYELANALSAPTEEQQEAAAQRLHEQEFGSQSRLRAKHERQLKGWGS